MRCSSSALPSRADIVSQTDHVRFVPTSDIPERKTDNSRQCARDVCSRNSLPAFARDGRCDALSIFISLQCAFMLLRQGKKVIARLVLKVGKARRGQDV